MTPSRSFSVVLPEGIYLPAPFNAGPGDVVSIDPTSADAVAVMHCFGRAHLAAALELLRARGLTASREPPAEDEEWTPGELAAWRAGQLQMLESLEDMGILPRGLAAMTRARLDALRAPARSGPVVSAPIEAANRNAAIGQLLADVGCTPPRRRRRE